MIEDKIRSFDTLEENWDSYGAKVVEKECIRKAIEVVLPYLRQMFKEEKIAAFPKSNGGISFEFETEEYEVLFDVNPDY